MFGDKCRNFHGGDASAPTRKMGARGGRVERERREKREKRERKGPAPKKQKPAAPRSREVPALGGIASVDAVLGALGSGRS